MDVNRARATGASLTLPACLALPAGHNATGTTTRVALCAHQDARAAELATPEGLLGSCSQNPGARPRPTTSGDQAQETAPRC